MFRALNFAFVLGLLSLLSAQAPTPTSVILPDGAICRFAGFGATVAFDGKRLNYTCGSPEVGLVGDVLTSAEQGAAERVFLRRGDNGLEIASRDLVVMTFGLVELEDGMLCAFAGRGATLVVGGKRLNYTCGAPEVGLLGNFDFENGVFHAERVQLDHEEEGFAVAETEFVAVRSLNSAAPLVGSEWRLESFGTEDAPEAPQGERAPTLLITERGIAGFAGCNRYAGGVSLFENDVTVGGIATTRMMCGEAAMSLETRFLGLLQNVTRFELSGDTLTLFSGDERLIFSLLRPQQEGDSAGVDLTSSEPLDPEGFNMRIGPMNADPLAAALSVLDVPNAPSVRVIRQDDAAEGASRSVITLIAEGLLDDAVSGRLTRLEFERGEDGRWTVVSALKAVQCRRGDTGAAFVAGPCP